MADTMTRLDFRLQPALKRRIERAAAATGQTISSFAVSVLLREANHLLAKETEIALNANASRTFIARLNKDTQPNRYLRRAAKRHRELIG